MQAVGATLQLHLMSDINSDFAIKCDTNQRSSVPKYPRLGPTRSLVPILFKPLGYSSYFINTQTHKEKCDFIMLFWN